MTTQIRQATLTERNKKRAVGVIAALTLTLVALIAVFGAVIGFKADVPVNAPPGETPSNPDNPPANTPIVFEMPVSGSEWQLLKEASFSELQFNTTANRWEACKGYVIGASEGTAVVAPYAGTIESVLESKLYGTQITIAHADGLKTVISSLDKNVLVAAGQSVAKGQQLGTVGTTETVEEFETPHARVELYKNGSKINPNTYIDFGNK
ncbi:MAG: M23 family metallopeptidase [Christensenellaceae bacterium]|nr:M23 family metallopeptidase [Christensenellaceae bacterium]